MDGNHLLSLLLVVFVATENAIGQMEQSLMQPSCRELRCTGKYEQCEVIRDTALCVKKCPECKVHEAVKPVCGSDGVTYDNLCHMQLAECFENIVIEPLCNGKCPCDPKDVENMDPETVHKLQKFRLKVHLDRRFTKEMQEETAAEEAFKKHRALTENSDSLHASTSEEMEKIYSKKLYRWMRKKMVHDLEQRKQQDITIQQTKIKVGSHVCSKEELAELPGRLLDWFHVLRANHPLAPVIREMSFLDAKLKAMYVDSACKHDPNRPDDEVSCLQPVRWMFFSLDGNHDNVLEETEVADIKNVNSEHCMKAFFQACDRNHNGVLERTEFCRCLCVEPPCTKAIGNIPTVLVSGVARPVPGFFVPRCNEDGFFVSKQCSSKECFCVDRNGIEIPETRVKGDKLTCAENTVSGIIEESHALGKSP